MVLAAFAVLADQFPTHQRPHQAGYCGFVDAHLLSDLTDPGITLTGKDIQDLEGTVHRLDASALCVYALIRVVACGHVASRPCPCGVPRPGSPSRTATSSCFILDRLGRWLVNRRLSLQAAGQIQG